MTPENFCYWLQGYFEISNFDSLDESLAILNADQVKEIRNHLNLVLNKVTPKVSFTSNTSSINNLYTLKDLHTIPACS